MAGEKGRGSFTAGYLKLAGGGGTIVQRLADMRPSWLEAVIRPL
jgi:hypothetical protein